MNPVSSPIFVLAPPRSFTSLFCSCLGQHPQLLGLPELNLFMAETVEEFWFGDAPEDPKSPLFWPMMRHGLLRTLAQRLAGEQTLASIQMAYRWLKVRSDWTTGELYQELVEHFHPLILVEKSPGYLRKPRYLERLIETFPTARFIHLLRHPRNQGESVFKVRGGRAMLLTLGSLDVTDGEPFPDPQFLWHDVHQLILDFLATLPPSQAYRVKGEAFIERPDDVFRALGTWLGLDMDAAALSAMRHPEQSPFSTIGPFNARLGNDIKFLLNPHFTPRSVVLRPLDEPLSWRPDAQPLSPNVQALAISLGY